MFQRFHAMKEQREGGFTLIELLVVILIIAILAAIAIPVFLRQREKGWRSQMESALKNAATAQESYLTANTAYAAAVSDLSNEGLKTAPDVSMAIFANSGTHYCMRATHSSLTSVTYYYSSNSGRPVTSSTC
ncbi:MAG TPA: prepilin-type N-terminal cleavage/methylation domain-containing protein [Actinomycetota bacterium]|nr:prepilin-type N-terminal cleavage/methylation domain-containing protein [Actinomycetota bacterium]